MAMMFFSIGVVFAGNQNIFTAFLTFNLLLLKNRLFTFLFLIAICSCHSQQSDTPALKNEVSINVFDPKKLSAVQIEEYRTQVEEVVQKQLLKGSFNGAILVAKDGDIVYENYVGTTDVRKKSGDSITADTPFQIASTGKTMTSAAVLKLWEEGKLDIEDEIIKYFPGLPYPGISVKNLLNHRSGLPEYLYFMEKGGWSKTEQATNLDVLNALIKWKPAKQARPGTRFQYTNTNYILLALIVEKVSGISFPEYMKQNFFEPLGMQNSFVIGRNEQQNHMVSFQANSALWALDFADGPYGDKNIYSTARDLLLWDRAITEGKVLQPQTLEAAYTAYSNEKPGIYNYGLGWRMLQYPQGKKVLYHNGHWHGFLSAFSRLPEEKATIIILTNRYNRAVYRAAKSLYEVFGNYNSNGEKEDE